jgi:hypothetical protein
MTIAVHLHALWLSRTAAADDRGQTSAEYALVLLGAAAVALLIAGWATHTNRVGKLLDTVLDTVRDRVK